MLKTIGMQRPIDSVKSRADALKERAMEVPPIRFAVTIFKELSNDDASHLAAGVAYYAVLSIFPLMLGLLALFTPFLASGTVRTELNDFFATYLPAGTDLLENNLRSTTQIRGVLSLISVLLLFWSASAVFGAISRAINRAWDIRDHRPFYIKRAMYLGMALAVSLLIILSLAGSLALEVLGNTTVADNAAFNIFSNPIVELASRGVAFLIVLGVLLVMYKYIPDTVTEWRNIWPGALTAAVLFEIAKWGFVVYLANFANYTRVYGSVATTIIFLVWLYFSAFILIIGAEVCAELTRKRMENRKPA